MKKYIKVPELFLIVLITGILFTRCENSKPVSGNNFPASKVKSVFCDESGIVWAGTDKGIISYSQGIWTTYEDIIKLPTGSINDIEFQNNNNSNVIWMATPNGIVIANYVMEEITSVVNYTTEVSGLLDNNVTDVLVDQQGARWFATPKGLSIFRGSKWYSETSWDDLVKNPVNSLGAKSDGWIFAGTSGLGVGRFRYDESIDGITGASYYNTDWSGIPSDTILSIYVDQNSYQWFGTPNGVACHTNWETKTGWKIYTVADGLVNNRVQVIMADKNGLIWIGTADGISSFDGVNWKSYSISEGLMNSYINDIDVDTNGTIWVATNGGISTFDGTTWKNFQRQ